MIRNFNILLKLEFTTDFNRLIYRLKRLPIVKMIIPQSFYANNLLKMVLYVLSIGLRIFSNLMNMVLYGMFFYGIAFAFFFPGVFEGNMPEPLVFRTYFITIFIGVTCIVSPVMRFHFLPEGKYDAIYLLDCLRMNARVIANTCYIQRYLVDVVKFILFFVVCVSFDWITYLDAVSLLLLMSGSRWLFNQINILYSSDQLFFEKKDKGIYIVLVIIGIFVAIAVTKVTYELPVVVIYAFGILTNALAILLYYTKYRSANLYILLRIVVHKMINPLASSTKSVERDSVKILDKDIEVKETVHTQQGFALFNALFFERHRSYLIKPIRITTLITLGVVVVLSLAMLGVEELRSLAHSFFDNQLASLMLMVYYSNSAKKICQAMFFNCDSSMLVYRFYRKKENLLMNFMMRLKTLLLYHLIPALTMGLGIVLIMFVSKYNVSFVIYISVFLAVVFMNLIFCIHSLVLYYLLQPYNLQMEKVGFTYRIATSVTYILVYSIDRMEIPVVWFSFGLIAFFVVYVVLAAILVYKVAPKTFRLRG